MLRCRLDTSNHPYRTLPTSHNTVSFDFSSGKEWLRRKRALFLEKRTWLGDFFELFRLEKRKLFSFPPFSPYLTSPTRVSCQFIRRGKPTELIPRSRSTCVIITIHRIVNYILEGKWLKFKFYFMAYIINFESYDH
ncbi:hypothetical protein CDAR_432111 [Caerostris darwini]|uniref:Uncharacterized protein n=1 Tax=Caerostris darwini TaxID=1538125 RepID=A0AAV4U2Z4_9ARAC|nr:hypothetical protein CDAR_432111 [Caerostris darwini]